MHTKNILVRTKYILLTVVAFSFIGISSPSMAIPVVVSKGEGNTILYDNGLMWRAGANRSGPLEYAGALAYIAGLNAQNFGGFNDWRLPSAGLVGPGILGLDGCSVYDGSCNTGYNITRPEAELAFMWHVMFGGQPDVAPDGTTQYPKFPTKTSDDGLIDYVPGDFWLAETYQDQDFGETRTWVFQGAEYHLSAGGLGLQKLQEQNDSHVYAWAVRTAFVPPPAAVPAPPTLTLFALALAVLLVVCRTARRKSSPAGLVAAF